MIYNGVELSIDLSNYETLEYYRKVLNAFDECISYAKNLSGYEQYKYYFESCTLFIDYIYGEGTCNKLFGATVTLSELYEVVVLITKDVAKQRKDFKGILLKVDFKMLNN